MLFVDIGQRTLGLRKIAIGDRELAFGTRQPRQDEGSRIRREGVFAGDLSGSRVALAVRVLGAGSERLGGGVGLGGELLGFRGLRAARCRVHVEHDARPRRRRAGQQERRSQQQSQASHF